MLITFIVTVAVLAVLYAAINICNKNLERLGYEFSTGARRSFVIFGHTGFCIAFSAIASEIIACIFWKNQTALWVIFGMALFIAIIQLLLLYTQYFTYEAITDDEVYVRRVFRTKKIKVGDIKNINNFGRTSIGFYDKDNKRLFVADSTTQGIEELVRLINERRYDASYADSDEQTISEEKAVLEQLGREYRESYRQRRKKFLITFTATFSAIMLAVLLLLYLIDTDTVMIIAFGVMGAIGIALSLGGFLNAMKKELEQDDLSLGAKYKFTNKKVKGAGRYAFKKMLITCIVCMISGAAFMLPLWGLIGNARDYDEFTPLTGRVEYCREQDGKDRYIAIAFYDNPVEYRLTSIYIKQFDYSFFDEVKVGDTVTVLIDDSKDHTFSLRGVSKKLFNSFYYLEANGKEYFSYEDYVLSHKHNDMAGYIIAGVGVTLTVSSAVVLLIGYFVLKNRSKGEEIEIYK